jgi:predicted nuclease with RNAse H fold
VTDAPSRSLGIDVSVRRGLDLVLLVAHAPQPAAVLSRVEPERLPRLLEELRPDVVAIDSPPAWGTSGGSRSAERELHRMGIRSYYTPSPGEKAAHPFYAWMPVGFRAFEAAAGAGFPPYRGGDARGTTLEVFPHASAVVLMGCLPPPTEPKRRWRERVLVRAGIDTEKLRSLDQVDAGLAALTGLLALRGELSAVGDAVDGLIVLPVHVLPAVPYRRCRADDDQQQLPIPGPSRCACGDPACTEMTASEFAPGHDAKRKALLWKRLREGDEAVAELNRRRWALPPELKPAKPERSR